MKVFPFRSILTLMLLTLVAYRTTAQDSTEFSVALLKVEIKLLALFAKQASSPSYEALPKEARDWIESGLHPVIYVSKEGGWFARSADDYQVTYELRGSADDASVVNAILKAIRQSDNGQLFLKSIKYIREPSRGIPISFNDSIDRMEEQSKSTGSPDSQWSFNLLYAYGAELDSLTPEERVELLQNPNVGAGWQTAWEHYNTVRQQQIKGILTFDGTIPSDITGVQSWTWEPMLEQDAFEKTEGQLLRLGSGWSQIDERQGLHLYRLDSGVQLYLRFNAASAEPGIDRVGILEHLNNGDLQVFAVGGTSPSVYHFASPGVMRELRRYF